MHVFVADARRSGHSQRGIAGARLLADPESAANPIVMKGAATMPLPTDLVQRYVDVWNEADPDARRAAVRELWAADGAQVLQPPEEMLDQAAQIGFFNPVLEARGHAALEARVARAHEQFIASGEFRFVPRDDATQVGDVVKFGWEMVPANGGGAAGAGLEFVILDAEGRIRLDYQFIEP
jgi:hypothetical protein